jgi:hypothetical protein
LENRTTPSFILKPSDHVQSIMGMNGFRQKKMKKMLQPVVAAVEVEGKTSSLRSKVTLNTVPHPISNDDDDDDAVDIEASSGINREQMSMKVVDDDALISNSSERLELSTNVGMMTPTNVSSALQIEDDASLIENQTANSAATDYENITLLNEDTVNLTSSILRSTLTWNQETLQRVHRGEWIDSETPIVVGNTVGRIQDGRLVVDVNHTHVFWNRGQTQLCDVLRSMTFQNSLDDPPNVPVLFPLPLLNVTMDCVEMGKKEDFGQGNWITALYCVRIAAAVAKVDYQFQCVDGRDSQLELLLPWFDGYHPAPIINASSSQPWPYTGSLPTEKEACDHRYPNIRVDKMADQIQDDIQKMAVTLVGSRDDVRQHPSISSVDRVAEPLVPNVMLDDVAIHFRCGDVMGGARRGDFGMIKFSEYTKWISKEARTIGILTQPFEKERNRGRDAGKVDGCRKATHLMVDYLQNFLPHATISIHNGLNETLPLAFARLAMANQSFTSLSSFGIFPVIGTFGEGYFQKGNRGVNPFAEYIPGQSRFSNIHQMNASVLTTGQMCDMHLNETLAWFLSE